MAIDKKLIDQLQTNYKKPEDIIGEKGLLKELTKAILERALAAEMTDHLGYEKHDPRRAIERPEQDGTIFGAYGQPGKLQCRHECGNRIFIPPCNFFLPMTLPLHQARLLRLVVQRRHEVLVPQGIMRGALLAAKTMPDPDPDPIRCPYCVQGNHFKAMTEEEGPARLKFDLVGDPAHNAQLPPHPTGVKL